MFKTHNRANAEKKIGWLPSSKRQKVNYIKATRSQFEFITS